MLFNEPKLLKYDFGGVASPARSVSVLFNEPKLLKFQNAVGREYQLTRFSALQRAEIAEIAAGGNAAVHRQRFSALQRAEIAEIQKQKSAGARRTEFQCSSTSRNC